MDLDSIKTQFVILVVIYVFALIVCMNSKFMGMGTFLNESLISKPGFETTSKKYRGNNYFANNMDNMGPLYHSFFEKTGMGRNNKSIDPDCIVTGWNMGHFYLHLLLGYLAPHFVWVVLFISIIHELVEYSVIDCHDWSDLLFNISGLALGYTIRKKINEKYS